MSKKKKIDPHVPVREINAAKPVAVKKQEHVAKQEKEGGKVVKWIFGVLIVLAIIFMIYSTYIVG